MSPLSLHPATRTWPDIPCCLDAVSRLLSTVCRIQGSFGGSLLTIMAFPLVLSMMRTPAFPLLP